MPLLPYCSEGKMESGDNDEHDSESNDSINDATQGILTADINSHDPDSSVATSVHTGLTHSFSVSFQDSKVQRVTELELRKCLGKDSTEPMLKSYACAWQKDILIQGRLYVTPNCFCFYSSILGWETKTAIRCSDVTSIRKQKTALVFPNAILIEVGHKKYGFGSVVYRDKVFHVLVTVWKNALSSMPLSETPLLKKINNWKHHSKDLPDHVLPTTCTTDESDSGSDSDPNRQNTNTTSTKLNPLMCDLYPNEVMQGIDCVDSPLDNDGRRSTSSNVTTSSDSVDSNESCRTESSCSDQHTNDVPSTHPTEVSSAAVFNCTHPTGDSSATVFNLSAANSKWSKECKGQLGFLRLLKHFPLFGRCSSPVLINLLLITFIVILLVSTLTMFCRLSQMEPSLQPYLILQPWCRLCSDTSHTSLDSLSTTTADSLTQHLTEPHSNPTPYSNGQIHNHIV